MKNEPTLAAFEKLWTDLGAEGDPSSVYQYLVEQYTSAPRKYHTLEHVFWALQRAQEIGASVGASDKEMLPIYWAIWFHDVHMSFDPRYSDTDEEVSADIACVAANKAGLTRDFIAQVRRLIKATAHTSAPKLMDEAILIDAGLSMLGADRADFVKYEELVRQEWAHVEEEDFCRGREKVLVRFACMPKIFTTDFARGRWEGSAKNNITWSRQQLADTLEKHLPRLTFDHTVKGFFHDGRDHTYEMMLLSNDYDRVQRYTTDADLVKVLRHLREAYPARYDRILTSVEMA